VHGRQLQPGQRRLQPRSGRQLCGWACTGNDSVNDYAGGLKISQYCSKDGYLVLRLTVTSHYYLGFAISAWFTNPTGTAFDVQATAVMQPADL